MNSFLFCILCIIGFINTGQSTPSPTSFSCTSGDLRLQSTSYTSGSYYYITTNYSYRMVGRLEIYYNYQWGTICDDSFDNTNAAVACKQLGYAGGIYYGNNKTSSSTYQCIWLDDVTCGGTESKLSYCSHNGYGVNNCGHSKDVAIVCYGDYIKYATCGSYTSTTYPGSCSTPSPTTSSSSCSQGDLRLTSYTTSYSSSYTYAITGRLEIYYNLEWGTICHDLFSSNDAIVACKELGYLTGSFYGNYASTSSLQCIWLSGLTCSGSESKLSSCSNNGWGSGNSDCFHSQDVAVTCYGNNTLSYATCAYYTSTYYSGYCPDNDKLTSDYNNSYAIVWWFILVFYVIIPIIVCCCIGFCIKQCCCNSATAVSNNVITIAPSQQPQPQPQQMQKPPSDVSGNNVNNPPPYGYQHNTPNPYNTPNGNQYKTSHQPIGPMPPFQQQQHHPMHYSIPPTQSVDQPFMYPNNQSQRQQPTMNASVPQQSMQAPPQGETVNETQ